MRIQLFYFLNLYIQISTQNRVNFHNKKEEQSQSNFFSMHTYKNVMVQSLTKLLQKNTKEIQENKTVAGKKERKEVFCNKMSACYKKTGCIFCIRI